MQTRVIKPEILDELAPDDPDALRNRRDLAWLNCLMGNYRWLKRTLNQFLKPGDSILELGAGLGDLGLYLQKHLGVERLQTYAGLDLWPRPKYWPKNFDWQRTDLLKFEGYSQYNVLVGNLIIHQFEDELIRELFQKVISDARLIVFCETSRRMLHIRQLPLLWLMGANYVSHHDARVSVEGGFRGRELPELMGLKESEWDIQITTTFLGAYRLVAVRK